jgi:DNA invertase Pin-like site-specific DNA recombinase
MPHSPECWSSGVEGGRDTTAGEFNLCSPQKERVMLTIMGGVAEFERSMTRERQREEVVKAKQAGKYEGRKLTMIATQLKAIRDRVAAGENKSALPREFGVTRQTVYNIVAA